MTKHGPVPENFLEAISTNSHRENSFSSFSSFFFFFVRQPRLYFITLPVLLEVLYGGIFFHTSNGIRASVVSQIKHIAKPALFISQSIELFSKAGWWC